MSWTKIFLKILIINKIKEVAGKQGFEPRFHDPESCVLPLDDFPAGGGILSNFAQMFNPSSLI
jgi:hypothetical protein